jgi:hypothetical protein
MCYEKVFKKKPQCKFWRRNILSCDSILLYSEMWQACMCKTTGKISRHGSEYVNILCANQLTLQKRKHYRRYIPYLYIIEMHCIIIRDETNPHIGFLSSFILGYEFQYIFHFVTQKMNHTRFDVVIRHINYKNERWRFRECIVLQHVKRICDVILHSYEITFNCLPKTIQG